ncbi:MAG: putative DCC family thiol-disulfide oxidoreductase YuxK [Gammaproteobacteria bacterium]|jgi:predicted DCC family thiol-disulfide oxidoreductase YuxK
MKNDSSNSAHSVVLFDGVCNLCNGAVTFIIKRDSQNQFRFAPIQSELGTTLLAPYSPAFSGNDSFALIENGQLYSQTDAALRIATQLDGLWYLFAIFRIIPPPLRDVLYRLLGRNRYRLFGKRKSCMIPSPELQSRFLTEANNQAGKL